MDEQSSVRDQVNLQRAGEDVEDSLSCDHYATRLGDYITQGLECRSHPAGADVEVGKGLVQCCGEGGLRVGTIRDAPLTYLDRTGEEAAEICAELLHEITQELAVAGCANVC